MIFRSQTPFGNLPSAATPSLPGSQRRERSQQWSCADANVPGKLILRQAQDDGTYLQARKSPRGSANASVLPTSSFPLLPSSAQPGTETSPDIVIEDKLKDAFERGWTVIVWNDPVNLMDYVVFVFKSVLKMNEKDASRHMMEVHERGKSQVARETREKSELIVHRLRAFGLNATMEQATR